MPKWKPSDIAHQLEYARERGWLPAFYDAAALYRVDPELLMGIASRETNMKNILGDGGHGHGLMQIDDRSFPAWTKSGKWRFAKEGILKGALVLREKWDRALFKKVPLADSLKVAVASYNAGDNAVKAYFKNGNPDARTTGKDYSRDVLSRQIEFERLLST